MYRITSEPLHSHLPFCLPVVFIALILSSATRFSSRLRPPTSLAAVFLLNVTFWAALRTVWYLSNSIVIALFFTSYNNQVVFYLHLCFEQIPVQFQVRCSCTDRASFIQREMDRGTYWHFRKGRFYHCLLFHCLCIVVARRLPVKNHSASKSYFNKYPSSETILV